MMKLSKMAVETSNMSKLIATQYAGDRSTMALIAKAVQIVIVITVTCKVFIPRIRSIEVRNQRH